MMPDKTHCQAGIPDVDKGYAKANFSGQIIFHRYRPYETTEFSIRVESGIWYNLRTAYPCALTVITALAAESSNKGIFSATSIQLALCWAPKAERSPPGILSSGQ